MFNKWPKQQVLAGQMMKIHITINESAVKVFCDNELLVAQRRDKYTSFDNVGLSFGGEDFELHDMHIECW